MRVVFNSQYLFVFGAKRFPTNQSIKYCTNAMWLILRDEQFRDPWSESPLPHLLPDSVRPSVCLSVCGQNHEADSLPEFLLITSSHFEWPEIWHADVFWSPSEELIRFWSSSVGFPHFGGILTVKQVKFAIFGYFWEHMRGMAWYLAYSCFLTKFKLIRFWLRSVDFPYFARFWLSETG